MPGPWCIEGEFYAVLNASERIDEGNNVGAMRSFIGFILQAKVVDIHVQGSTFTWSNNKEKSEWARLDRFLLFPELLTWLPKLIQKTLPMSLSNHNPVFIGESREERGLIPFCFFNWWLEEKSMMGEVSKRWKECKVKGSNGFVLFSKAKAFKMCMKR